MYLVEEILVSTYVFKRKNSKDLPLFVQLVEVLSAGILFAQNEDRGWRKNKNDLCLLVAVCELQNRL